VAGEAVTFPGTRSFMEAHGVQVVDLGLEACRRLMADFIERNPRLWAEDIGED
jgi:cytosine deaminase